MTQIKKDKMCPRISSASTFDAVVLRDGDYPSHPVPLSILSRAQYLVCCDGAGMHHILHGGTPDAIVGDATRYLVISRDAMQTYRIRWTNRTTMTRLKQHAFAWIKDFDASPSWVVRVREKIIRYATSR